MYRSKALLCVLAALLVLTASSVASATQKTKIRYLATKGDTTAYKMNMHGETTIFVEDQSQLTVIDNEMLLTQRTTDYDEKSDTITFQTTIDSGKMTINGVPSPLPMIGQTLQTKMLGNGEILSSVGANNQNLDNMQLVFPKEAITVGSTWTKDIPANPQVPVPLVMTYKVLSFEKYRDIPCVKLATTITSGTKSNIEGMSLELDAKGKIFFDYTKGTLVSNRVNSDMRMIIKRVLNGKATSIITRMRMSVRLEQQL